MSGSFLDTNVLLYLASADTVKADRAEALLTDGCTISVQVLNEMANVLRRKVTLRWDETRNFLAMVRAMTEVVALDAATHDEGLRIAERYQFSIYDSMIAGAALRAGCETLWSEDMQDGLRIDDRITVRIPFALSVGCEV